MMESQGILPLPNANAMLTHTERGPKTGRCMLPVSTFSFKIFPESRCTCSGTLCYYDKTVVETVPSAALLPLGHAPSVRRNKPAKLLR